jgi:4a-hydroxytetrahydrobiopterin dehydratase
MNLGEITSRLEEISNWGINGNTITKQFEFENFSEALDFVNKVGKIAELHAHHPDITIRYNIVVLSLTDHSTGELTEKDFVVAKAIDTIKS